MISKGDIVMLRPDLTIGTKYGKLVAKEASYWPNCYMIVTGDKLHHDIVNCSVQCPDGIVRAYCYTRDMLVPAEAPSVDKNQLMKFL